MTRIRTRCLAAVTVLVLLGAAAQPAAGEVRVEGSDFDKIVWDLMILICMVQQDGGWFFDFYTGIEESEKEVTVKLVRDDPKVYIDSFKTNEVDIGDLGKTPGNSGEKSMGMCEFIVHFMSERFTQECHEDWEFHQTYCAALENNKKYRCALGLKTYVCDKMYFEGYHRFCIPWCEKGEDGKEDKPLGETYLPVPLGGGKGIAKNDAVVDLGNGVKHYTFSIDTSEPHTYELDVPEEFGGGEISIGGFSGTYTIETRPSEYSGQLQASVIALELTAPAVPLPTPFGSTGINRLSLSPNGGPNGVDDTHGFVDEETGMVSITYYGHLTNDLFPATSPTPFFAQITGIYDPASGCIEFETLSTYLATSREPPDLGPAFDYLPDPFQQQGRRAGPRRADDAER